MSPSEVVLHIPNREIHRMVFLLARCYRNSSLVAPKYHRNEKSTVCIWVKRYEILLYKIINDEVPQQGNTYTLSPGPIPRHEITKSSLAILKLAIWDVIDATGSVGVDEDFVDNPPRITIPDLIIGSHPFGCGSIFWTEAIVLASV